MANLWRALALSWLGGIASPVLAGDAIMGDGPGLTPTLSRSAEEAVTADYADMDEASPERGFRPEFSGRQFTRI